MTYKKVNYSAKEHADLVNDIPAESKLKIFNIFRHVAVSGKRIVDIGCGDGSVARAAIERGATFVLGLDSLPGMIKVANDENKGFQNKIEYRESFIEDEKGDESYDVAILSYLLNNAESLKQLKKQVEATYSFLKPGGVAIIYNSNPFDTTGGDFTKYGFRKKLTGTNEGDQIIFDYRPAINEDIINYYISPQDHEAAFLEAGFSGFSFEKVVLDTDDNQNFWKEYFDREHLPVICMLAKK